VNKVQKGDLVKLFRRKHPGLGLVVKEVEDITSLVKQPEVFEKLYRNYFSAADWGEYHTARDKFTMDSGLEEELACAFLNYSKLTTFSKGERPPTVVIKKAFMYVRWVNRPSEYEVNQIRAIGGWYPTEWLKKA
tara:strand:+ start:8272 stop:8673 length:402 start_codon:yes stop_codon:yes gene_type:complete